MKTTLFVDGIQEPVLNNVVYVNMIDLTERKVEGVVLNYGESLLDALLKSAKENELFVYKGTAYSESEWEERKKEFQKEWLRKHAE